VKTTGREGEGERESGGEGEGGGRGARLKPVSAPWDDHVVQVKAQGAVFFYEEEEGEQQGSKGTETQRHRSMRDRDKKNSRRNAPAQA